MKKVFTLSMAVCAAAGMWAAQPDAVCQTEVSGQATQEVSFQAAPVQMVNTPATASVKRDLKAEAAASRAGKLQVAYRLPKGTYFPWMKLTTETGGFSWPLRMSGLLPAYTEVTWDNISNKGRDDEGNMIWQETSMKWMQIDPETNKPATGDNANTFSTDCDWVQQTTQSEYDNYGMYAPYLRFGAYGYFSNWEDNNGVEQAEFYQIGGSSLPDDATLSDWQDAFPNGVDACGGLPVNLYSSEFQTTQWLGCYDFVDWEEDYFTDAVADYAEELGATITDAQMLGFAQEFAVPSPMILRALKGMLLLRSNDPLTLTVDLIDAESLEVFATSSCTLEAYPGDDTTGDYVMVDFPFTSVQGIDEVDYIPVNKDFVAVIRGFQGAPGIVGGAPMALSFKYYTRTATENIRVYNVNPTQQLIGYWTSAKINGTDDFQGIIREGHVWGKTGGDFYALPCSFMLCADMDLPFLQANSVTKKENGNWGAWQDVDIVETHEVVLNQPNDKLFYEYKVGCPGLVDEVSVSVDGEEVPEWLNYWVENGQELEVEQGGDQYAMGQKYFYMGLGLADGMETAPENIDVTFEYMGCKQVFHVVAEQGGVENITADAAAEVVSSKYFDLQGRALVAEPAQGLYIRQDLMSNGTVRNNKIVK